MQRVMLEMENPRREHFQLAFQRSQSTAPTPLRYWSSWPRSTPSRGSGRVSATGACLDRESIRRRLNATPPLLEGYRDLEAQLQPNGFDLTLGGDRSIRRPGVLTEDNAGRRLAATTPLSFGADGALRLEPGPYLVTSTRPSTCPRT